jgi:glycosyltransferase involved in cell wall biosynthesis
MNSPKISVVMPSYNQAQFIEESITSILNQSYKNFELIIVDGLSKDGTIDILKKYEHHEGVKKIIVEKDKGQTDALDKGFRHCSGDIFTWLNSDDTYAPGAFQHIVDIFTANPDVDLINGELDVINEKSEFISKWPRKKISNKSWMHYPQTIGQPSTFFTAKLFKQVGGINPQYNYAMDYDLFFRFALSGARFFFTDQTLANFRVHSQSKTMALPYKFWKEEINVFYKLSNKKIFSAFYYWKFRGIVGTILREKILHSRKF